MSCRSFGEGHPICGHFGTCVNGTICECDKGWSQSEEFQLFVDKEELDTAPCNHNETVIQSFYIIILVASLVAALIFCVLGALRIRDFKRDKLTVVGLVLMIVFSAIRVNDPNALFAVNLPFTFFLANANAALCVGQIDIFIKYLDYLKKSNPLKDTRSSEISAALRKISVPYVMILDVLFFNFWWLGMFSNSPEPTIILVKASLVYIVFRASYVFAIFYLIHHTIDDLKQVVATYTGRTELTVPELDDLERRDSAAESVADLNDRQQTFIEKCKEMIPKLRNFRLLVLIYVAAILPFYIMPIFSDFWFVNLAYIVPLEFATYAIVTVLGGLKVHQDF